MLIQQAPKHGVNPEYYALVKASDLEEVENLPDDCVTIEGLDKISEYTARYIRS